jgi:RNA polymerase sigma factor (TIGR02999 family)
MSHIDEANRSSDLTGASIDHLIPLVYAELRQIAHRQLAAMRAGGTFDTTALVNEAYLKLAKRPGSQLNDRLQFLGLAAIAMKHILMDRAKARRSAKRGRNAVQVTLDETIISSDDAPDVMLQITDALDRLATIDGRLAKIVDYRFFGELTSAEIGVLLGITERTVERDWIKARILLRDLLAA